MVREAADGRVEIRGRVVMIEKREGVLRKKVNLYEELKTIGMTSVCGRSKFKFLRSC